ncbi:hypothetical protein MBLNU459_g2736t1 [Dothideomycetes sp. NU459]
MTIKHIRFALAAFFLAACFFVFLGASHQGVKPTDVVNFASSHLPLALKPQHNNNEDGLAYMTFLAGTMANLSDSDIEHDKYFVATRILGYQLMHQPETRTRADIPFVVLVTEDISQEKRDRLEKDGATVIEVEYLRAQSDWIVGEMPEWRDVMTKLRAWELTQYSRVLFLDGDMLLLKNLDGVFDDPMTQFRAPNKDVSYPLDEGELTHDYVMASMPEANPFHTYPPTAANKDFKDIDYFNAGFFVFAPSKEVYNHYKRVMDLEGRFDPQYPEQNLMNYAHRKDGPMPWQHMNTTWNIRFPHMPDVEGGVHSLHDKWWHAHMDESLQPFYTSCRWKMEGFYEARDLGAVA